MKHLFSYSVYQELDDLGKDLGAILQGLRCDGLELLTSHEPVDPKYSQYTVSVHLPYTTDWLAAWEGRPYEMSDHFARYYMYGKDKESVCETVRNMIDCVAPLKPAHGVIHACNVNIPDLCKRNYSGDCRNILLKFCEMINTAISGFPKGEPPVKLAFENLWWPGLRLKDDSDYRILEKHLEFENWGICLDTGHLMNCLPGIYTEQDGIEALLRIFDGYSQDLKDAIGAMHFHYSASAKYRESFEEKEYTGGPITDFINGCYHHINTLDQHLPYSDPRCRELIEAIQPELVIHELPGHGHNPLDDFAQQRSLL
ncbi:MAG: sugar phosphate isomerase/epimerase [Candidatus Methanomethylophilaceae archaeon]|nr:sugar phosphate isomerase/epimerase [Candidatus Methanomethylophilaceae archaeon]